MVAGLVLWARSLRPLLVINSSGRLFAAVPFHFLKLKSVAGPEFTLFARRRLMRKGPTA